MSAIIVRLRKQGGEQETLRFEKEEIYIGRLEQNDITLSMTNVSKKHAIIWIDNETVYVSDAGSTNGTYVNKRRIAQPTPLTPNDEVYIGDFIFEIQLEQQPQASPPQPSYEAGARFDVSDSRYENTVGSAGAYVAAGPGLHGSNVALNAGNIHNQSIGGATLGGAALGAVPPSRGPMPPPPRGNTPQDLGTYGKSVASTQVNPTTSRLSAERNTQQTDDLNHSYEGGVHEGGLSFQDIDSVASNLDYDHEKRRDTAGTPSASPDIQPAGPGGVFHDPSRIDYGSSLNKKYEAHDLSSNTEYSTRSESATTGAPVGPAPAAPKSRFPTPPNTGEKPAPSYDRGARVGGRPAGTPGHGQGSHTPKGGEPPTPSRKLQGPALQRSSLLGKNNDNQPVELFQFPNSIPETQEPLKQSEREQLFESFILSLESDGINPLQISPLSEDLLTPYITRIDTDEETRRAFVEEILRMGPLVDLMKDESISEIFVNRHNQIVVKREGALAYAPLTFHSRDSLLLTAKRLASLDSHERDITPGTYVDIRFRENASATVSIPEDPELDPLIVIQRKRVENESLESLVEHEILSQGMATFLARAMASGMNILVAGPLGSQKLRFISSLSSVIPSSVRLLYISRGHQIQLPETGISLVESRDGTFDVQSMLTAAVSLRPDRIFLEQIKGVEAYTWVTAIATSIEGCVSSISASSTQDALGNLLTLSMLANHVPSPYAIKEQIARSIDIVVVLNSVGGHTRVVNIAEVDGVDIGSFRINDIFRFKMDDSFNGHYEATGYIPQAYESLRQSGIEVDISIFRE